MRGGTDNQPDAPNPAPCLTADASGKKQTHPFTPSSLHPFSHFSVAYQQKIVYTPVGKQQEIYGKE
jgi:hypothetical protein